MKKKLIEAHEAACKAYEELRDNPDLVAPQFGESLAKLAIVIMDLTRLIDACVETEQVNGGLN